MTDCPALGNQDIRSLPSVQPLSLDGGLSIRPGSRRACPYPRAWAAVTRVGAARVGQRAMFRPDGLRLEVARATPDAVTTRAVGPPGAAELGQERTVSAADWRGMHDEGTILALPDRPSPGDP